MTKKCGQKTAMMLYKSDLVSVEGRLGRADARFAATILRRAFNRGWGGQPRFAAMLLRRAFNGRWGRGESLSQSGGAGMWLVLPKSENVGGLFGDIASFDWVGRFSERHVS